MEDLKTLKRVKFWFLTQNDDDVLLFSHQTSSMKHQLTETREHNFEIHNMALSSQSSLVLVSLLYHTYPVELMHLLDVNTEP